MLRHILIRAAPRAKKKKVVGGAGGAGLQEMGAGGVWGRGGPGPVSLLRPHSPLRGQKLVGAARPGLCPAAPRQPAAKLPPFPPSMLRTRPSSSHSFALPAPDQLCAGEREEGLEKRRGQGLGKGGGIRV